MENGRMKKIEIIHLISGLFFTVAGITILVDARYLFGLCILSLGLLLLFDALKRSLQSKLNPKSVVVIHYVLAAFVLVTGITALLISSEII